MCKKIWDSMCYVSRKKCKSKACKSAIEGAMVGILIGSIGGIVVGMMANSNAGRRIRNKMLCECMDGDCSGEDCN